VKPFEQKGYHMYSYVFTCVESVGKVGFD